MNFETDILNCLRVLQDGGMILYPTDTIWGIGCDATNEAAVAKIFALKKRPDAKSLIVLVAEERDILRHVAQADLSVFDFLKTVSKPTTVVYEGAIGFAQNLINHDGTIAIRICNDEFCRQLIKRFRKPLVSTSANISGAPFPKNFSDIENEVRSGVDYTVTHRQNDEVPGSPSALIKWQKGIPLFLRS